MGNPYRVVFQCIAFTPGFVSLHRGLFTGNSYGVSQPDRDCCRACLTDLCWQQWHSLFRYAGRLQIRANRGLCSILIFMTSNVSPLCGLRCSIVILMATNLSPLRGLMFFRPTGSGSNGTNCKSAPTGFSPLWGLMTYKPQRGAGLVEYKAGIISEPQRGAAWAFIK